MEVPWESVAMFVGGGLLHPSHHHHDNSLGIRLKKLVLKKSCKNFWMCRRPNWLLFKKFSRPQAVFSSSQHWLLTSSPIDQLEEKSCFELLADFSFPRYDRFRNPTFLYRIVGGILEKMCEKFNTNRRAKLSWLSAAKNQNHFPPFLVHFFCRPGWIMIIMTML